jgi:hypothetical protein
VAIIVSTNAQISINGIDFSDHCLEVRVNDGQETREVTAMGDTSKRFRAGLGNASVEATFWNDVSSSGSGSIVQSLYALVNVASTGFPVLVRKVNTVRGPGNPEFSLTAVCDGDINLLDEKIGDVGQIKARFLPYSSFAMTTTTSS